MFSNKNVVFNQCDKAFCQVITECFFLCISWFVLQSTCPDRLCGLCTITFLKRDTPLSTQTFNKRMGVLRSKDVSGNTGQRGSFDYFIYIKSDFSETK